MATSSLEHSNRRLDPRQFQMTVRRLASALGLGENRSPRLGSGIDFVQSRHYQPGDSIRAIDWRATARAGVPFLKEYEVPRRTPIWLALDTSASMMFGMGHQTKYETALLLAGGLGLAAQRAMNPVGIVGVGERSIRTPPSLSQDKMIVWLQQLSQIQYGETTAVTERLGELTSQLRERSMVLLLSDLHDADIIPALAKLSLRHECVVLELRDPASRSLRGVGFLRGREAETGRPIVTSSRNEERSHQQALRRIGVDSLLIDVDRPYLSRLKKFVQSRAILNPEAR